MANFEVVGTEFYDHLEKNDLKNKETFVDFFMVYYEYALADESIEYIFEDVEQLKNFLLKELDNACKALKIDYTNYQNINREHRIKLWWYLQLCLARDVFKVQNPVVAVKTVEKMMDNIFYLSLKTLELQMMFVNILWDGGFFVARPVFHQVSKTEEALRKLVKEFTSFFDKNESMFSVRRLKNNLVLPYDLTTRFLTKKELFADVFTACLFDAIPMEDASDTSVLKMAVTEFIQDNCIPKAVTKEARKKLQQIALAFAKEKTKELLAESADF